MKIRLLPDKHINPDCKTAWLICSYKMHPKFVEKFKELGFELTEVDPETTPYYGKLKLFEIDIEAIKKLRLKAGMEPSEQLKDFSKSFSKEELEKIATSGKKEE